MRISLPKEGSPTRTELALRCYRRHWFENVMEYWPEGSEKPASARFGNVMHQGVAQWWKNKLLARPELIALTASPLYIANDPYAAMALEYERLGASFETETVHTLELADSLLAYYTEVAKPAGGHWASEQEGWEVLVLDGQPMIEQRCEVVTPGGFKLRFQIDRIVTLPSHKLNVLVDLKTAGSNRRLKVPAFYKDWSGQWDISIQLRLYKWGVKEKFGVDVDVQVEGLLKVIPSQLRYHACPDWDEDWLNEAVMLFDGVCREDEKNILHNMEGLGYERKPDVAALLEFGATQASCNYMDCHAYYTPCQFLPLCTAKPSDRLAMINSNYKPFEGEW